MSQSESRPSQQSQFQQPVIRESDMPSQPQANVADYHASGKLQGRVALITGGDSGIGHAVAVAFAREGADGAPTYVFLASNDSSYMAGQVLHLNGGDVVNG